MRDRGDKILRLDHGEYHFHPEGATVRHATLSNNDSGTKCIAFDLSEFDEFTIDGGGSRLIFHGFVVPFFFANCSRITLSNLSIIWERPFHTEGRILSSSGEEILLEISPPFSCEARQGQLVAIDERGTEYPWGRLLEFDSIQREPAFQATDYWGKEFVERGLIPNNEIGTIFSSVRSESAGGHLYRLRLPRIKATPGNMMVLGPNHRSIPAVVASHCQHVTVSDVVVHHAGAMAFLFQKCRSVELRRTKVVPPDDGRCILSATADATHFVGCRGPLVIEGCEFRQQLDDAVNVHGNYARVAQILSGRTLELELVHAQHLGFDLLQAGDWLEFSNSSHLRLLGEQQARYVSMAGPRTLRIELEGPRPHALRPGDVACNLHETSPDVTIHQCIFSSNRARGLLLGSRGKVRVTECFFHTPGSAILFAGDGTTWFEQGGARDVLIENNTFRHCGFGVWGRAIIESVHPSGTNRRANSSYYSNIRIRKNSFEVFDDRPILQLESVSEVLFDANTISASHAYGSSPSMPATVLVNDCPASQTSEVMPLSHP